jgi:hypothetical protein
MHQLCIKTIPCAKTSMINHISQSYTNTMYRVTSINYVPNDVPQPSTKYVPHTYATIYKDIINKVSQECDNITMTYTKTGTKIAKIPRYQYSQYVLLIKYHNITMMYLNMYQHNQDMPQACTTTSTACTSNMCYNLIKKYLKHASISPRNAPHTCTKNIPHTMHKICSSRKYQCLNKIPKS